MSELMQEKEENFLSKGKINLKPTSYLEDLKKGNITFNQFLAKVIPSEKEIFEKLEELKKNKYVENIYVKYNEQGNIEFHGSLTPLGKGKFSKNYYTILGGVRTYNEDVLGLANPEGQTESPYKRLTESKRLGGVSPFETQAYVVKENEGEYEIEGAGLTKATDYLSEKANYLKIVGIKK